MEGADPRLALSTGRRAHDLGEKRCVTMQNAAPRSLTRPRHGALGASGGVETPVHRPLMVEPTRPICGQPTQRPAGTGLSGTRLKGVDSEVRDDEDLSRVDVGGGQVVGELELDDAVDDRQLRQLSGRDLRQRLTRLDRDRPRLADG